MLLLQPYLFPPQAVDPKFTVAFSTRGGNTRLSVTGAETRATETSLLFDRTYRITVRAEYKFRYCKKTVFGQMSPSIVVTTAQTG